MEETLFCRTRDKAAEIWDIRRLGPRNANQALGLERAEPFTSYERVVQQCARNKSKIFIDPKSDSEFTKAVFRRWCLMPDKIAHSNEHPPILGNWRPVLGELRLRKSPSEITTMRGAAKIAAQAIDAAAAKLSSANNEADLAALISAHYIAAGSRHAFNPIIAGGPNACVLHYCENNKKIFAGSLVLIDTGCDLAGYASDITRIYPANGRFTAAQEDLYNVVLEAQLAALDKTQPGNTFSDAQEAAQHRLAAGLRRMGILAGSPARLIKTGQLDKFFMHNIGHWIGLDVHDVGSYRTYSGAPRKFESGMCLTLEPGLYLGNSRNVPAELRQTGVRIEDTVLITRGGSEVLTCGAPKTVAEIEAAMSR